MSELTQLNDSTDPWLMNGLTRAVDDHRIDGSNALSFADSFVQPIAERTDSGDSLGRLSTAEPTERLPDSQLYIQCLERKLDKLKGKTKDNVSSKDVVNSLQKKCDALFEQFLRTDIGYGHNSDGDTHDTAVANNPLYSYVERRLFPRYQALTTEELQRLLEADMLEKINAINNASDN